MDDPNKGGMREVVVDLDKPRWPRVVVVGAGIAGTGAVGALLEGGIKDVVLLEAQDRPGGRVKSITMEDGFVELGAQFLHGQNEMFSIAQREGMLADEPSDNAKLPDTLLQFRPFAFRTEEGEQVNPRDVTQNLHVLENLLKAANEDFDDESDPPDYDTSVGQFFRSRYTQTLDAMTGKDDVKDAMFRWLELWENQDAGGPVEKLSLAGDAQYEFCPGNGTRVTTQGMEEVFKVLHTQCVPEGVLRLNKPVKTVHWTPEAHLTSPDHLTSLDHLTGEADYPEILCERTKRYSFNNNLLDALDIEETKWQESVENDEEFTIGTKPKGTKHENNARNCVVVEEVEEMIEDKDVDRTMGEKNEKKGSGEGEKVEKRAGAVKVECEDGEVFEADHVIVTASVGVLRNSPGLFSPRLDAEHRRAVSSMGFGNVAKMFLLWDGAQDVADQWAARMLGEGCLGVIPLWREGASVQIESAVYKKPLESGRQWWEEVSIVQRLQSHAFCLLGWVAGEAATVMEALPAGEVRDVLFELLTRFLSNPDLPMPNRFTRTEWHTNPYTRGAYSYLAAGVPLSVHAVLSQPLPSPSNPMLQLAGEACSKHFYSTMHGALQSGRAAAKAILKHHGLDHRIQDCKTESKE